MENNEILAITIPKVEIYEPPHFGCMITYSTLKKEIQPWIKGFPNQQFVYRSKDLTLKNGKRLYCEWFSSSVLKNDKNKIELESIWRIPNKDDFETFTFVKGPKNALFRMFELFLEDFPEKEQELKSEKISIFNDLVYQNKTTSTWHNLKSVMPKYFNSGWKFIPDQEKQNMQQEEEEKHSKSNTEEEKERKKLNKKNKKSKKEKKSKRHKKEKKDIATDFVTIVDENNKKD